MKKPPTYIRQRFLRIGEVISYTMLITDTNILLCLLSLPSAYSPYRDYLYEEGQNNVFSLICHPQIIGRPGRMKMYEGLIRFIKGHANVEFMTFGEASLRFLQSEKGSI